MKKEQVSGLDFFRGDCYKAIEKNIKEFLNSTDKIDAGLNKMQRAMGDVVEEVVCKEIENFFPKGTIKDCKRSKKAKAMGDVSFKDVANNLFLVDVKTRNINKEFNMPNLTSVRKIWDLYKEDDKYFVILLVEYEKKDGKTHFSNVKFYPIEWFDWKCLRIGALGNGQIQIKKADDIKIDSSQKRYDWLIKFHDIVIKFYEKEKAKIDNKRIKYFNDGLVKLKNKYKTQ